MDQSALEQLKERLENAPALDAALAEQAVAMMADDLAGMLDADAARAGLLGAAEDAIHVIGHVYAGWALTLDGHASSRDNARWRCTLRETRGDDDQIVGIGNAATMRLAMLAAVAHIRLMRLAGYV